MSDELNALHQRLDNLYKALLEERDHRRRVERENEEQKANLRNDLGDANSQHMSLQRRIREQEQQLLALREERNKLQQAYQSLTHLPDENELLRKRVGRLEEDLTIAREGRNTLHTELAAIREEFERLAQAKNTADQTAAFLRQMCLETFTLLVRYYLNPQPLPLITELSPDLQAELKKLRDSIYH